MFYDPSKVSYAQLLEVFWRNIDPLTPNRQFCDRGSQYRSAIFYHDAEQERRARASKVRLQESGLFDVPIVTEIVQASAFYPAEGIPPGLLREARGPLQGLPVWLWTRPATEAALGRSRLAGRLDRDLRSTGLSYGHPAVHACVAYTSARTCTQNPARDTCAASRSGIFSSSWPSRQTTLIAIDSNNCEQARPPRNSLSRHGLKRFCSNLV